MPLLHLACTVVAVVISVRPTIGMGAVPKPAVPANSTDGAANIDAPASWLSSREFWLSVGILLFGLVVVLSFLLLKRHGESDREVPRIFVIVLIVIGTMWAMAAGFSQAEVGMATALFGSVAGYLLSDLRHERAHRSGGSRDGNEPE